MLVIGHRGWPKRYPENTLVGFQAAIDLGVDFIELDVHLSKDSHIVVMHDEDVSRTTDGRGSIRQMTLSQIKELDAGSWHSPKFKGERVPTLEEALELASGKVGLALEVKHPGETCQGLDRKLIRLLQDFPGDLIVISFDLDYLKEFKRKAAHIQAGFLCMAVEEMVELAAEARCDAIHPSWRGLDGSFTRAARHKGLAINTWTALHKRDCRAMLKLDVDGIAADCPDVLLKLLGRGGRPSRRRRLLSSVKSRTRTGARRLRARIRKKRK